MGGQYNHYRFATIWYLPENVGDQWSLIGTLVWRTGKRIVLYPYPHHPAPSGEMSRWNEFVRQLNARTRHVDDSCAVDRFLSGFKNGIPSPHGGATLVATSDSIEATGFDDAIGRILVVTHKQFSHQLRRRHRRSRAVGSGRESTA